MNGDGLCFINDEHELEGFRVNRVEGNRLYPFRMPENLRPGMPLYRNNDRAFENILAHKTAERKVCLVIDVEPVQEDLATGQPSGIKAVGYVMLTVDILGGSMVKTAEVFKELPLEKAKRPQRDNIVQQMSKLGDTIYEAFSVDLHKGMENYFVPNSVLTALRRELIDAIQAKHKELLDNELWNLWDRVVFNNGYGFSQPGEHKLQPEEFVWQPEYGKWGYLYNIANFSAYDFYQHHGLEHIRPAFELGDDKIPASWNAKTKEEYDRLYEEETNLRKRREESGAPNPRTGQAGLLLMQCRHCIRYSLGYCVKRGGKKPTWKEPLRLRLGDGREFRLEFVCKECQMNLFSC